MIQDHSISFSFDFHDVAQVKVGPPRPHGEGDGAFVARHLELLDHDGKTLVIKVYSRCEKDAALPVTVCG